MEADFDLAWVVYCPELPPAEAEHRFDAARRWRFDRAWPRQKVAVEIDGGQWSGTHGGRHNRDVDRIKGNEAAAQGWLVFHFSHELLAGAPDDCCAQVRRALLLRMRGMDNGNRVGVYGDRGPSQDHTGQGAAGAAGTGGEHGDDL